MFDCYLFHGRKGYAAALGDLVCAGLVYVVKKFADGSLEMDFDSIPTHWVPTSSQH